MRNLWLLFLVGVVTGSISEKLFVSSQTSDDLYIDDQSSGDLPIDDEDGGDDGSGSGSGDYGIGDLAKEESLRRFLNLSWTTVSKEMFPVQPESTADSQDRRTTTEVTKTTLVKLPEGDSHKEEKGGEGTTADWFTESTTTISTTVPSIDTTTAKFIPDNTKGHFDEDNSLDRWGVPTTKGKADEGLIKEEDNEIVVKDGRGSRIYDMETPEEVTSENLWERTEVLAAVIACGVVGFLCAVFLLLLLGYRMKKKDEGSYDLGDTKVSSTSYHKAPTKEFYA